MIRMLINAYCVLLVVDAIVAYVPAWKNMPWRHYLKTASDWGLKPIRQHLRPWAATETLQIDLSPLAFFALTRIVFWLW